MTRLLVRRMYLISSSPLWRALAVIGTLWCARTAFNFIGFAKPYLLRSRKALDKYTTSASGESVWAFVTGSSDGVGKGFAEELCSRGINVILHGRNEAKLHTVRASLLERWPDRQVRVLVLDANADASNDAKLNEAAKSLEDVELRILINNVGGNGTVTPLWAPLSARSSSDVGQFIDINARFTTEITRVLLPLLIMHQPSLILNVGSAISEFAVPYLEMYSGTKAYMATLSKSLRVEMKVEGNAVEVIHLQVGMVATEREKDRVPGFMTPSSRCFAGNALDLVGCGHDEAWPHWPHAVQFGFIRAMPGWLREKVFLGIVAKERAAAKRE